MKRFIILMLLWLHSAPSFDGKIEWNEIRNCHKLAVDGDKSGLLSFLCCLPLFDSTCTPRRITHRDNGLWCTGSCTRLNFIRKTSTKCETQHPAFNARNLSLTRNTKNEKRKRYIYIYVCSKSVDKNRTHEKHLALEVNEQKKKQQIWNDFNCQARVRSNKNNK